MDFYLPAYNICIEVDGDQHRKPITFFGGADELARTKQRDLLKERLVKDNLSATVVRFEHTDRSRIERLKQEVSDFLDGLGSSSQNPG